MGNSSSSDEEEKEVNNIKEKIPNTTSRQEHVHTRRRRRRRMSKRTPQRFLQIGNISVSVVKGNIKDETTEVIVNSCVPNLNLSHGGASKALLDAAGPIIQSECKSKYPSGITTKDVAVTGCGNLPCKAIYHVTLTKWQNQGDEKNIEYIVRKCLEDANTSGYSSMSFPALGTGLLKYPTKTVAASMFSTVESFAKSNPNSAVKKINCVVFTDDTATFKDFLDEARARAAGKGMKEMDLVTQSSVNSKIGNLTVNITVGSIVTAMADVIVNSCPTDMKLESRPGLAKVVSEAAGKELQDEINQKYPNGIQVGDLAITDGYKLKCKQMFHGTLTSFFAKRTAGLLPEQVLYNFVQKCLDEAGKRGFRTIAFPALGTGFVKFPPKTAASNVIKAIRDFQTNNWKSSVVTVNIIIFGGSNDWTSIEQAYKSEFSTSGPQSTPGAVQEGIPQRGTRDFLAYKYNEDARTPRYWTHFKSSQTIKDLNTSQRGGAPYKVIRIDPKSQTYQSISTAFNKTHNGSTIQSIDRIENILLFEQYMQESQRTFRKAYVNQVCTPLKDVPQSSGTACTMSHLNKDMSTCLYGEINEFYLFHGTKVKYVDVIIQQGLDDRLASSGLLGTGVYAAEMASKSDAYTDTNANGESKMFLMRVCLGDIFITKHQKKYKRPPCKQCYTDTCTTHPDLFDSVVAEFGQREFVVYDRTKCYPEYLITYK